MLGRLAQSEEDQRRLVQDETAAEIARLLKPGGQLRFVTDWKDYADWALERLSAVLSWTAESQVDWNAPPADHVTTRYESKRLGDCAPVFLDFVKG